MGRVVFCCALGVEVHPVEEVPQLDGGAVGCHRDGGAGGPIVGPVAVLPAHCVRG